MSDIMPSGWLRHLLGGIDVDSFRQEHWTRRPYFDAPRPERMALFARLFPSFDIGAMLHRFPGKVRVWLQTPVGAQKAVDLPADQALDLHACGYTLYAIGHPALRDHGAELAHQLECHPQNVHGSLFANRAGTSTPMHFDRNENFTIQLVGRKRWHVAPNRVVENTVDNWVAGNEIGSSMRRYSPHCLHRAVPRETTTYDLAPGSLLYLPRGYWHGTDAEDDSCVSVNFSICPTTWLDVALGAVHALLVRNPRWRQAVIGFGEPSVHAELRHLLDGLGEALRSLDPSDVLGLEAGEAAGEARLHRLNPLSSLGFDQLDESGSRGVIEIATQAPLGTRVTRLAVEDELVPACAEIAAELGSAGAVDWGARLSGRLTEDDVRGLLSELCAAGLMRPVP